MGELLRSSAYPRNAIGKDLPDSADRILQVIDRARRNELLEKDEPFNDARTFLRVVDRNGEGRPIVTEIGEQFSALAGQDSVAAWRWLLTRTLWRFCTPNGTKSAISTAARELGTSFNLFDLVLRTAWVLRAQPKPGDVLFFDELIPILDSDEMWSASHLAVVDAIMTARRNGIRDPSTRRQLLGDLENEYSRRDYLNTAFCKAFPQTGLFTLEKYGQKSIGIRISADIPASPVLWRRLTFLLDNPVLTWTDRNE